MSRVDDATATQIRNIEASTGRSLTEWIAVVDASGLRKHGQILAYLKSEHGFTHGNANLVAVKARESIDGGPASPADLLAGQYSGPKAALLPVHDRLVAEARSIGTDVEVVIQKTAVSLRRAKQFAVVRAPSASRVELGLNLRGVEPRGKLQLAGGMCTHRIDLHSEADIDDTVLGWLLAAYDQAG